MKPRVRSTVGLRLVVVLIAAILGLLAFLQVHWSGQVSQAERDRMMARLHTAVARFRGDLYLELLRVCWAFQIDAPKLDSKALAVYGSRYQDWQDASAHPDLVANLFVWKREGRLLRYDPVSGRFKAAPWPARLSGLEHLLRLQNTPPALPGSPAARRWYIDQGVPALFHPAGGGLKGEGWEAQGDVIVELNGGFIQRVLLPMLAERYFRGPGGLIYRVAVIRSGNPAKVIYESIPAPAARPAFAGDVVVDLIGPGGGRRQVLNDSENKNAAEIEGGVVSGVPPVLPVEGRLVPRIYPAGGGGTWKLIVRHRSGSVEAAVLGLRHRNLAVSLGVLLLLGISMALLVISAQRAQRLAHLQMDFVAGVSHELRTPLAVICSAAENLADGVVGAAGQVKSYGALIRNEGRRLTEMVEQVLAFAAQEGGRQAYNPQPLDVASVARGVIDDLRPLIESSGAVVELHTDAGLSPVIADPAALRTCLNNLLSNAIKYGGERPSVIVRARMEQTSNTPEVHIRVEDEGIGIAAEDLPHIFEPFYRGRSKDAEQIHGTGLGLSLARRIAEAMAGRLTVRSTLGKGSCFTLTLPAAQAANHRELTVDSQQLKL